MLSPAHVHLLIPLGLGRWALKADEGWSALGEFYSQGGSRRLIDQIHKVQIWTLFPRNWLADFRLELIGARRGGQSPMQARKFVDMDDYARDAVTGWLKDDACI